MDYILNEGVVNGVKKFASNMKSKIATENKERKVANAVANSIKVPGTGYTASETVDKNGNKDKVYSTVGHTKKVIKEVQQNIKSGKTNEKSETINKLKSELKDLVEYQSENLNQTFNPRKAGETGVQGKGRDADLASKRKRIDQIVKDLKVYGVKVDITALNSSGKVIFKESVIEGGCNKMNREEIKSMRLEVYEDASAGKITGNMKEYLLTYLEYVDLILQQGEAYTEAVSSIIEKKRSDFIEFVERSFEIGSIDKRQRDVMLEMSGEDFMFETPTPDMIPSLVMEYLEAAKEGNEDAKAEIKEKLDTAKELEKIANQEVDEVTESASESLQDKLKELKIKLTDEEKEIVEKLDEKIQKALGGDESDEEDEESNDDSDGEGDESKKGSKKEEPVEESAKFREIRHDSPDMEKPNKNPANKFENSPLAQQAKKDGYEFNGEDKDTDKSLVKEMDGFSSKSGLTDAEKKEMRSYVKEAAEEGVYTEEDLRRIMDMLQ